MVTAKVRLRAAGRRAAEYVAPSAVRSVADIPRLRQRIRRVAADTRQLRDEVRALRAEVQETRRLHQRVAELTDVVAEVLIHAVETDDVRVQRLLAGFAATSFGTGSSA